MRILHTESSCGWGGQELRILSESLGMIERGHQVHLLCPENARFFSEARAAGLPVTAVPIEKKRLRGFFALRKWLNENSVDVINTHSSTDAWLVALVCTTLGRKAPPVVRTRHISAPISPSVANRWLYAHSVRHVVTTGEKLRLEVCASTGAPLSHVTSIPTGIDAERFSPASTEIRNAAKAKLGLAGCFVIGIVATLRSWKGHALLLEALASLNDPSLKLLIVGDGPQKENLAATIEQLNLQSQAFLCGHHPDVLPYLHAMDIFALPSYANEGVPQALMQALLCGIASITTDIGSISEVAIADTTALVVPPKDAPSLAGALLKLVGDSTLRSALGAAARQHIESDYSRKCMLDRMEVIFHQAIDETRTLP